MCDNDNDCRDGTDEPKNCTYKECTDEEFTCQNSKCIKKTYRCDKEDDCGDNSDEFNCGKSTVTFYLSKIPSHFLSW